jgi:hypothetical protein
MQAKAAGLPLNAGWDGTTFLCRPKNENTNAVLVIVSAHRIRLVRVRVQRNSDRGRASPGKLV